MPKGIGYSEKGSKKVEVNKMVRNKEVGGKDQTHKPPVKKDK